MNRLEDFVQNNREEFDKFEPGPVVWHNIQQQLKKPVRKDSVVISMKTLRWSAAAAVLIIAGAIVWLTVNNKKDVDIAGTGPQKNNEVTVLPNDTAQAAEHTPAPIEFKQPQNNLAIDDNAETNEELAHYAGLVELKQRQIMKIKKDEPLLYQQFAGDFNRLDSSFHILKKQLPVNPNREQILEAMIQNLQMQEALLNQQLNIIKKINNTKKEAYEKAYKTI